jgi:hypothetical protein
LAVLHALADLGEAEILACIYSSERNTYGAGCMSAINHYYGRPGIPIGVSRDGEVGDPRNDFLEAIACDTSTYRHDVITNEDASDLVTVYREALASSPDGSVTIISIGHTKGLYSLLQSGADRSSLLQGWELVRRKVLRWVAMAGQFPAEVRPSWNFGANGAARYSQALVTMWPTPIVFSGYEVGKEIVTGRSLRHTPLANPVREAYRLWENALETGRASWDQTAVLYAVRGLADCWSLRHGACQVDDLGTTSWTSDTNGPHAYLVAERPAEDLALLIDGLMASAPKRRPA